MMNENTLRQRVEVLENQVKPMAGSLARIQEASKVALEGISELARAAGVLFDGRNLGAEGVTILDGGGQVFARLQRGQHGGGELRLFGPDGSPRVILEAAADGGRVVLLDADGGRRELTAAT